MSTRKVLHLISQAHLDPVWLWPLRDGVAETLTTCQSAIDRLRENPDFRFTRSSADAYRRVRDADPRLFAEIQKAVAEGRWEIVGGWVEQPDCNLPSAESFLRQAELGQAFFEQHFGCRATIGYNVDSFGHCGGLPQLLSLAGMDAYAFMRPEPWDNPHLPLLFWWEGPDGSRVLACRIPGCYSQSYSASADDIEKLIREASEKNFAPGFDHGVMWFGVGNHGGGPTREHIARVKALQSDLALPEIRFSTLREFVDAVLASPAAASLPVWRGELGYVFRGCYAANGETKRLHRACEKALFAAESLAVGAPAAEPPRDLRGAWWELLSLQFHDILAGTCVAQAQEEILHRFGSVLATARESALAAALRTARRVDTSGEVGSVLFATNPLPWPRRALIQLDTFVRIHGRDEIIGLEAPDGSHIPIQWLRADANFGPWGLKWGKLTAAVDLPPSGYRVLRVLTRRVEEPPTDPFAAAAADSTNPQFSGGEVGEASEAVADIRPGPALPSLPVSGLGELLAAPVGFVAVRDTGGTWGHGRRAYDEELGRPESLGHEILESGDLVNVVREKFRWGRSEIWLDVIRVAGSPVIELRIRINWQEHRQQLKLELLTRLAAAASTHARMPAEVATRPTDGSEFPCHDWVALQGTLEGRPATLAVLNDSTYSYAASGGALRFTLVRGVPHAEHPPFDYKDTRNVHFLDQGWQERRFGIAAFEGAWSAAPLDRLAQEFQIPAIALLDSAHPGDLPHESAGISVEPASVAVLAIRPAEDEPVVLVRLAESSGHPVTARVRFPNGALNVPLDPWKITTVRLNLS